MRATNFLSGQSPLIDASLWKKPLNKKNMYKIPQAHNQTLNRANGYENEMVLKTYRDLKLFQELLLKMLY